jgi:hypothetical protein
MKYAFRSLTLCGLALTATAALAQTPDCSLVPGWKQDGSARTYAADTLFEYMDGNSEGYLIYRFVKMNGVTCKKGADTIVFDVSEMADPEMAFGIFASNRDPRQPVEKVGMMAQLLERRAIFAKDKYFVELAGNPANDADLRAFMLAMEKRVPGSTELPDAIGWFPEEKLDKSSIRLVPESVLGIRLLKRGYVAQYDFGKAFLVKEDSPEAAAGVMTKLKARFGEVQPAQIGDEAFQVNDKYLGRLAFFRKGRYISGFAGVKDGSDPVALSGALAGRIR